MDDFGDFEDFEDTNEEQQKISDFVDPETAPNFPGYTEYEIKDRIFDQNIYYVPRSRKYYWGHWEITKEMPIFSFSLAMSSYFIIIVCVFPLYESYPFFLGLSFTFILAICIIAYAKIIIEGPGYIPFYFPLDPPNDFCGNADISPCGVISYIEQYQWARHQSRPNRCILSSTDGRYIIRPDRFFKPAGCWIGKRNEKHFLLLCWWGLFYLVLFCIHTFEGMLCCADHSFLFFILFGYFILGSILCLCTAKISFLQLRGLLANYTNWERWNSVLPSLYSSSIAGNCADVFGKGNSFLFNILPFSPWTGLSNEQLIDDYRPYTFLDIALLKERKHRRVRERRHGSLPWQRKEASLREMFEREKLILAKQAESEI